ncbi:MAG: YCF48-related protein [bacterium]
MLAFAQSGCKRENPSEVPSNTSNSVTWSQTNGPLGFGGGLTAAITNEHGDFFVGTENVGILVLKKDDNRWHPAAEGMSSAQILSLAISANGHIFAGTTSTLFRSTDNGVTWQDLRDKLPPTGTNKFVRFIAVNQNADIVASVYDHGLYRSTDNGENWQHIGFASKIVRHVKFASNGHVYAGEEGGYGIFRSTDDGQTWTAINNGIRWASRAGNLPPIYGFVVNSQNKVFAAARNGIYVSENNGDLWKDSAVGALSIAIDSEDNIFAGGINSIIRSVDNGDTWIMSGGIPEVVSFAFDSDEKTFAVSQTEGLFQSTNKGESWSKIEVTIPVKVSALDPLDNGQVYAATANDGIFVSPDQGNEWLKLNENFALVNVNSIGVSPQGSVFVTTAFNGIFRLLDQGQTWVNVTPEFISGFPSPRILSLAVTERGALFVATESDGILRSTNNGEDWMETNNGLEYLVEGGAVIPVGPLALHSDSSLYVGTDRGGVFVTHNEGGHWKSIGSVIGWYPVTAIAANAAGQVFVGMQMPARVFRLPGKDPQAGTPDEVYTGVGNSQVLAIAIDKNDHIFFSTNETVESIYLSTDNGQTMHQISEGLEKAQVGTIKVGPDDEVYAGTSGGVFRAIRLFK